MLQYSSIHIHDNTHLKLIMNSSRANITLLLTILFVHTVLVSLWHLEVEMQSDIKWNWYSNSPMFENPISIFANRVKTHYYTSQKQISEIYW